MINYILQVMLFQLAFLAIYDLLLKKETFFVGNRIYLLSTPLISFLIPFVKIPSLQDGYSNEFSILLPEIILSPQTVIEKSSVAQSMNFDYGILIFWTGCIVFFSLFLVKLLKLNRTIKRNKVSLYKDFKLVTIAKTRKAFSFFNYIFLGEDISEDDKRRVIKHEIVHSRQMHSFDLLIFEILKIGMWFNPLLYIFQKRIATVHEFISDSYVIKTTEKDQYVNTLLNELFEVDNFSFINQFAKTSILKKRIIMMTKEKSKQIMRMKYFILLPLFSAMLFYVSCSDEFQNIETFVAKKQVQKMYLFSKDGLKEMSSSPLGKETYIDFVFAFSKNDIPDGWKEITKNELTNEESDEYDETFAKYEKLRSKSEFSSAPQFTFKLYRDQNNRGIIGLIPKFNSKLKDISEKDYELDNIAADIPFAIIDKIPTFPGCQENDKNCFNKKMQLHFISNFDNKLPNKLGLSSGKKRLIMMFVIGKDGVVRDVKVKAPHKSLEEESERVIKLLPKMIPGESNGVKSNVKYTLPVRIDVE